MMAGSWPIALIRPGPGWAEPRRHRACSRAWLVPVPPARVGVRAALAGAGEASRTAETLSEQTAISSAQAAALTPARASMGQVHGRAHCRAGSDKAVPGVSRSMGQLPMMIWEAGHERSC